MKMFMNVEEMSSKNNYVVPTVVLQRLLAAAAAHYRWNGDSSASVSDTQISGKLGVQLSDVGIQSVVEQLCRLESSPPSSSSSASSSSDVTIDQVLERSKKTSRSSSLVMVNPARYKTELCRQFEEHGSCRYGDKCQFAHGAAELRTLVRHPKYKTEMCRTFHTTGFCPYGLRCHFIHNDDERRATTATAGVLDSTGRLRDAAVQSGSTSPLSLTSLTGDQLVIAQPPQLYCRPIFRSSPTEVYSEQRGRPILARGSTLPECSFSAYDQHVSFATVVSPAT